MRVIDAHAHIFPDKIAEKATLATADYFSLPEPPIHYGYVQELLDVLKEANIDYALVFSAATNAHQVESINRYIHQQASIHPRFLPCGTLHAAYEPFAEELAWMRAHGIHGVKLHPEMQHFVLNDKRLFPMFEEMASHDMFLISHTGDPRTEVSGPERMYEIARAFPSLRCVATHLGNWNAWDADRIRPMAELPNVYCDISSSFSCAPGDPALFDVMHSYDPTHLFWGSDYPFWCPQKELEKTLRLGFSDAFLEDLLFNNFANFYHYKTL